MMSLLRNGCLVIQSLLVVFSAFGNFENEGFLGDSFHGVFSDESGAIINQVGPFADMVKEVGISAFPSSRSIDSTKRVQLNASLILDDGTVSKIPPFEVEWFSPSKKIEISENLAIAKQVSQNVRVSIIAHTKGYSARFFIWIKREETVQDTVSKSTLPLSLKSSIQSQVRKGWVESDWFGAFYNFGNNWINHSTLGWLYASGSEHSNSWFWSPYNEWIWTGPKLFPYFFRNKDGAWIYYIIDDPEGLIYNFLTKNYEIPL